MDENPYRSPEKSGSDESADVESGGERPSTSYWGLCSLFVVIAITCSAMTVVPGSVAYRTNSIAYLLSMVGCIVCAALALRSRSK